MTNRPSPVAGHGDGDPDGSRRAAPGAAAGPGPTDHRGARRALADGLRRVQALHPRGLPRRVPHRRALPHRVRHGRRAGRRVQRLRLLRRRLPLRGHRAPTRRRGPRGDGPVARHQHQGRAGERVRTSQPAVVRRVATARSRTSASPRSARCATTGSVRGRRPRAPRPARRPRSSSATSTRCAPRRGPASPSCTSSATPRRGSTASDENDGVGGTGSVFLLLDEPEVYGLPPDPRVTTADLPDMFRKAGLAGAGDARHGCRRVRREATVTTNPLRRRPPAGAGTPARPPPRQRPRPGRPERRSRRRDESLMVPDVQVRQLLRAPHRQAGARGRRRSRHTSSSAGSRRGRRCSPPAGPALGYPALRRAGRIGAVGAAALGGAALAKDLGKPSRALNMMRTVKLTSPMSVGSWILTAFSGFAGLALASEVGRGLIEPPCRRGPDPGTALARVLAGRSSSPTARPRWGPRSSRRRSPPTRPCCSPTRRPRRGTSPTVSCPSSSSARPTLAASGLALRHRPGRAERPGPPARRRERARRDRGLRADAGQARADAVGAAAHRQGRPACSGRARR